ncbi:MAG: DMT family transporter [Lachnospiraceae bacterium]
MKRLGLVCAALIWGSAFVVMKHALDSVPTNMLLFVRFFIAALLLSVIFFRKWKLIDKRYLMNGFCLGFLMYMGYYVQTLGLAETTPGKNAFLTTVYCVMVPFFAWLLEKECPERRHFVAAVICVVGLYFVSVEGGTQITMGRGDTLSLLCGVFYASHIVCATRFSQKQDVYLLTILQFYSSALCAGIMSFLQGESVQIEFTVATVSELLYLAVFATAIALLLQNVGQKSTDPSQAAILLSLESVFGVIFSILFYNEVLSARLCLGFVLIFIAVLISEIQGKSKSVIIRS